MKKVFVYGDSNVWGDNIAGSRIAYHLRWTSRLRRASKLHIHTDSIPGRVAGSYRLDKPEKNGRDSYAQSLQKEGAVDLVIIALGTNDLQQKYNRTYAEIIDDLKWYRSATPRSALLYLLPAEFATDNQSGPEFTEESLHLRNQVLEQKDSLGWSLPLNTIQLSDGIHFSEEGHREVSQLVYKEIKGKI